MGIEIIQHELYVPMTPLVSVIMPVFNAEKYLPYAIESILKQTFMNFELIIINDGSTDHSEQLILRYKDKRIRYIKHLSNQGLIATLNNGIKHANGEFIARLDADDVSRQDRLFKQLQFLLRHPDHSICASSYDVINAKGHKQFTVLLPTADKQIRTLLFFGNCICHSSVMFRKKALDHEMYRQSYKLCEDYDLWSRMVDHNKVSVLSESLIKYRLHGSNVSVKNRLEMLSNVSRIHAHFLDHTGLAYSRDEFLLHHAFLSYNVLYIRRVGYEKLEKWIIKLGNMFFFHEDADPGIAEKVMIRRWLTVCLKGGEYKRLLFNPFITSNGWYYISCFLGKILDSAMRRKNAFDF